MATEAVSFISRLYRDKQFRQRFVRSPKDVLSEAGLDPDALALPDHIDEKDLSEKLDRAFSGREWQQEFMRAEPATLTVEQLWDRFGVIGWKRSGGVSSSTDVAAAVVIYGVSMVTSSSSQVTTQVAGSLAMVSVEQLRALRELARLPREQLRFSIVGPDGIAIEGVNADMLAAFLARVK